MSTPEDRPVDCDCVLCYKPSPPTPEPSPPSPEPQPDDCPPTVEYIVGPRGGRRVKYGSEVYCRQTVVDSPPKGDQVLYRCVRYSTTGCRAYVVLCNHDVIRHRDNHNDHIKKDGCHRNKSKKQRWEEEENALLSNFWC